jgi:hypothetical protein
MRTLAAGLLGVALAGNLTSQVLRVGPTRPFATIQAALTAAPAGAVIVVDPGTYPSFAVRGRGVAIVGDQGSEFTIQGVAGVPAIEVRGIPAGQTASIANVVTAHADANAPAIDVSGNAGTVRLHRVRVDLSGDVVGAAQQAAVEIADTSTAWLATCTVWSDSPRRGSTRNPLGAPIVGNAGLSALQVLRSGVVLQDCRLRGYDAPPAGAVPQWGGDALRLREGARASLSSWVVRPQPHVLAGGAATHYGGSAIHVVSAQPVDAPTRCGFVSLLRGAGSVRAGGFYAINNDGGIVNAGGFVLDRTPTLCPFEDAGETRFAQPVVPVGGSAVLSVWAPEGNRGYAAFTALSTRLSSPPPGFMGLLLLDVGAGAVLLSAGFLASSLQLTLQVPNVVQLTGLHLSAQAVLAPAGGSNNFGLTLPDQLLIAR